MGLQSRPALACVVHFQALKLSCRQTSASTPALTTRRGYASATTQKLTEQASWPYRFDRDTFSEKIAEGIYRGTYSDNWNIVKFPNGGYVLACAVRAMQQETGLTPLSLSANYLGPAQSNLPYTVHLETVKQGKSKATLCARVFQNDREHVRVMGTLVPPGSLDASGREHLFPRLRKLSPPSAPPLTTFNQTMASLASRLFTPRAFRMAKHMETLVSPQNLMWMIGRPTGRAELSGWIRFKDKRPIDNLALTLLCDAFPPPVLDVGYKSWVPTIDLSLHVRSNVSPGTEWVKCVFRSNAVQAGYVEEDGELWDENGNLLAMSRQLAQLFPMSDSRPTVL
eukprot:comp7614_c0_seq1/m.3266 comp7614_c0_seq1/g.3266  ORF comp7614_c0_seq1/g.3266 comp7614_c0_seq1/m.3266 type:complete len:339 (-) comp7614_c0_seq1:92-1108(-)